MVSIPQYSDEWRISLASRIHNCCIARLQRESVVVYFWDNSMAAEMRCFGNMMSLLNWDPCTMWPIISGWKYPQEYIFLSLIDLLVCLNTYTYIYICMPTLVVQNCQDFSFGYRKLWWVFAIIPMLVSFVYIWWVRSQILPNLW